MAAGEIHIINGVRYQEQDAQRLGLLDKGAKPTRNKARKAPNPPRSESKGGADNGGSSDDGREATAAG